MFRSRRSWRPLYHRWQKMDRLPKQAAQVWEDRPGDGRRNAARAANSVQVAAIKGFHLGRDDVEGVLHREGAGIEPLHFRSRKHFEKGVSAFLGEEDVVLPPEGD